MSGTALSLLVGAVVALVGSLLMVVWLPSREARPSTTLQNNPERGESKKN